MSKVSINIVWFKRDLRFTDHEPLYSAKQESLPLLLVYFFEPSLMTYDDNDIRHWRFVHESLLEMQDKLKNIPSQIIFFIMRCCRFLKRLRMKRKIKCVMKGIKKQHLPVRICKVCARPFTWRKKWEKTWEDVKYCSDNCRNKKNTNEN